MYAEWPSIKEEILGKCHSVLHTYPPSVGREVAKSVVSSLLSSTSNMISSNAQRNSASVGLTSHNQVKWTMEVICYGLTLPLSDFDTLKGCVTLYVEWLSVATNPKTIVPHPIISDRLPYIQMIISHLENLFIPKSENNSTNQLNLCQKVLRAIQLVAREGKGLDRETWDSLLKFVLNVSNILLAPPSTPNGLAEQLCELLMQTLFEVWILACNFCFPTPSFWKTFQILFVNWRHHPPVVEWWSKITAALTSRLLTFLHGPNFPTYKIPSEVAKYVPKTMDNEHITQTWFRILHLIKDPVELSNPNVISKSDAFRDLALKSDITDSFDLNHHSCLKMLPYIFLKAMKGISSFADAFLGLPTEKRFEVNYPNIIQQIPAQITPTSVRKSGKAKKGGTSTTVLPKAQTSPAAPPGSGLSSAVSPQSTRSPPSSAFVDMHPKPTPHRPQCNSILHLFGKWLFDASLASCKFEPLEREGSYESRPRSSSIPQAYGSLLSLSHGVARPSDNLVSNPMFDSSEFPESSDAGRAEACGTLCRLMCCKKTSEHILPMYLSRFYLVLSQGMIGDSKQVQASILLNSVHLMRIDLPGVTCLLPPLLTALESILPDKELPQFKPFINPVVLRRAAIHLLISVLPLPLHYTTLEIENVQDLWTSGNSKVQSAFVTFQSLKKRMLNLLIGALQCEDDPVNTQMILGALLVALHDSALFESVGTGFEDGRSNIGTVQPGENENVPVDTAYGLYVHTIQLVSLKLLTWKSDLSVSLAALELLSGLAKARVSMPDRYECRKAVRELCHYIVHQRERPPPQHKRELHSMIVTAFHTLATWLLEHPYLLEEKNCLYEVLEIVELGISGSKSKPVPNDPNQNEPDMKSRKELNPVSMRVMEAAEGLLILVFKHVGAFPTPCSPSSMSSLLDERSLLFHTSCGDLSMANQNQEQTRSTYSMSKAVPHFRYFILHGGIILSILEQNLGNEQEPVPTVTILIRNPSGRKVWTMQLRQTPRSDKLSPGAYLARPNRPLPSEEVRTYHRPRYRTFPEEVDRIPLVKADCSIPPLSEVPGPEHAPMVEKMHKYIELQKQYDDNVTKLIEENAEEMPECVPLQPTQEFQTARLLLSHLNLLSLDSVKPRAKPQSRPGPDLVMLNTSDPSFAADLESFDSMPTRNHNTVFVFYVKAGQNETDKILANVSKNRGLVQPAFAEFLLSLGWPVDVNKHPGWTGKLSTSWKLKDHFYKNKESIDVCEDGPGIFNGQRYILYYADACTEMAFIVPSLIRPSTNATDGGANSTDRSKLTLNLSATPPQAPQQDSPPSPMNNKPKSSQLQRAQTGLDSRVAVVWCEDYDSFETFSLETIESEMVTGEEFTSAPNKTKEPLTAILIHPLESGLFRIQIHKAGAVKTGVTVPLVSGMVVSRRVLGLSVRMTAMNICSRRRLANDSYQPPFVRRKQRIMDLLSKYHRPCTEPEFFTAMFTDVKPDDAFIGGNSDSANANLTVKHPVTATT